MMNQIQMWQLIVDIGLITSVLTMTMRAFKSSRLPSMLPKTRELEASLRSLIGDAETAGLQLNDQLLRREQNIQRALTEIQQSEARIAKAVAEAALVANSTTVQLADGESWWFAGYDPPFRLTQRHNEVWLAVKPK
jgi:hypothetical protein